MFCSIVWIINVLLLTDVPFHVHTMHVANDSTMISGWFQSSENFKFVYYCNNITLNSYQCNQDGKNAYTKRNYSSQVIIDWRAWHAFHIYCISHGWPWKNIRQGSIIKRDNSSLTTATLAKRNRTVSEILLSKHTVKSSSKSAYSLNNKHSIHFISEERESTEVDRITDNHSKRAHFILDSWMPLQLLLHALSSAYNQLQLINLI